MNKTISNSAAAFAFGVLLMAGLLVNSHDVWAEVLDGGVDSPFSFLVVFFSYTPTNLLCVAVVSAYFSDKIAPRTDDAIRSVGVTWWSSVGVGVGVWFGMLASQVGNSDGLLKATQDGYLGLLTFVGGSALGLGIVNNKVANRQAEMIPPTVYRRVDT